MADRPNPFPGWSLPFEEQPTDPMHDTGDAVMVGGLVVMGAVIPSPLGSFPALVFRFQDAERQFLRPIALVLDAVRMRGVPPLVTASVEAAIRRAGGQ
jgi:hypothetical protein